jgi:hypothetical protein
VNISWTLLPFLFLKQHIINNGTNKISGAAVIRCLLEEGVDLVYGYPVL